MMMKADIRRKVKLIETILTTGSLDVADQRYQRLVGAMSALQAVLGEQSHMDHWMMDAAGTVQEYHRNTKGEDCDCEICRRE
jgi:hypothetical protein